MTIKRNKLPVNKNKTIEKWFSQAVKDANDSENGKKISDGEDAFGYNRQLFAYEILRAHDIEGENLEYAKKVNVRLQSIFRDILDSINVRELVESLTLCLYGFVLGNYNEEDLRFVYRYSLGAVREHSDVEKWLRKALVFLGAVKSPTPRKTLSEVRNWISFMGAPLHNPSGLVEFGTEFGVDFNDTLNEEDYRIVDTLRRHSQYLKEAVESKTYHELREATKDWLPDVISSRILSIFRKTIYEKAQKKVTSDMSVSEACKKVKSTFKKEEFQTHGSAVLPIRLQELSAPPIADAVDPIVFELIPQKLRRDLLPSVAYSTATKNIEIIFLGGRTIGRSGILIKTDTGGILMDFGLSVANQRVPEWVPELEMIDTVLVSHAHLDHVGGLPVLYENYSGKWCSTSLTGAITKSLLDDAIKIGTPSLPRRRDRSDMISWFKQSNIDKVGKSHVKLEVGKSSEVGPGIVVTPIDAAHIPGSVSYLVDIEGVKILYTGDFNLDKSVLFPGATLPTDPDVVIFDGTYWGREDFDRGKVTQDISRIIEKKGPVIIPSFAVGRSQEMLMILEELGITNNRNVMVAGLAEQITKIVGITGHWQGMKKNKVVLDKDDVLVAGGGMMSGGLARHHFKEQRSNPNAAVIPCGYMAPRTPGWNLINGYEPHDCELMYARLSAHSSATNLEQYIKSCKGKKVMIHTPVEEPPKGLIVPDFASRLNIPVK
ncbi:MAG: MBL fold metallo-hydrolase [Candidatus Thorarchaeota archaeon]